MNSTYGKSANGLPANVEKLNMTQSNLADQLLVSYQAISNWERGNTLPDIEKIVPASNNFAVIH